MALSVDGRTLRPWKRDDFDPADHPDDFGVAQDPTPKKVATKKAAASTDADN